MWFHNSQTSNLLVRDQFHVHGASIYVCSFRLCLLQSFTLSAKRSFHLVCSTSVHADSLLTKALFILSDWLPSGKRMVAIVSQLNNDILIHPLLYTFIVFE